MLVKIIIFNRLLHPVYNVFNRNFLCGIILIWNLNCFRWFRILFRTLRLCIEYIYGAILIYSQELIYIFGFADGFEPFDYFDSAFFHTGWFIVVISRYFTFTHKKWVECVNITLATPHNALLLRLKCFIFFSEWFW